MNIEEYRTYCLSKPGTTEHLPFDEVTLVFKVCGKMFALTNIETFASVNLKCDPELAIELREQYAGVVPGFHMNKKHWNTIYTDQDILDQKMYEWIDHSYNLVVAGLPKRLKETLL